MESNWSLATRPPGSSGLAVRQVSKAGHGKHLRHNPLAPCRSYKITMRALPNRYSRKEPAISCGIRPEYSFGLRAGDVLPGPMGARRPRARTPCIEPCHGSGRPLCMAVRRCRVLRLFPCRAAGACGRGLRGMTPCRLGGLGVCGLCFMGRCLAAACLLSGGIAGMMWLERG